MPPPTKDEMQSIIDALKDRNTNPNQYKLGMPDSGPFMGDRLNYLGKIYQGLAPAAQQVDPFASFPHEPMSGDSSPSPYTQQINPFTGKVDPPGTRNRGRNPYLSFDDKDI